MFHVFVYRERLVLFSSKIFLVEEEEEGGGIFQFPESAMEKERKIKKMGVLKVFNLRENVLGKKGVGVACPYCGGPVLAWNFDTHLLLCCIPIYHKLKTKFYCTICSTRLVFSSSNL
ncbi:hypothetical protein F8388_021788 [Cannabis sativa]|uniref:Uncharacterized protein n=1 Tax=Cannabis sativa TaxID=3483 RepID=A0A7J6DTV5_CANSA|nr:hypothetical protein F8388_021788 [Cannabis sativa]